MRHDRGAASPAFGPARAALARNLRTLRAVHRLSQVDLAAEAGMTPGAVSMIETHKANPTMDTLERIARAFGVDVTALFADRNPKS
jgi:transcriptional regulator with XRE-family HTH domain